MIGHEWHARSSERIPDGLWEATVTRVRSEFEEMPCLRVTAAQARVLFGLPGTMSDLILRRLEEDGFLIHTPDGQYVRRNTIP